MSDFEFFYGTWDSTNRRLAKPLTGSAEWDEFPGKSRCWELFSGGANVDEIAFPTKGWSGLTLRLFDPEREEWTIYWANSRDGRLQPPVVGRFNDGRGEFFGDDTHEGTPVRVRYIWSRITPTSARWEQAFSVNGERSWETNWVMDFTRTG